MIDEKAFEAMRKEYEENDRRREKLIAAARESIRLARTVMNFVHRQELPNAASSLALLKKSKIGLMQFSDYSRLDSGSFKAAMQEYVEACCIYEFSANKRIPTADELEVEYDHYMLGLCDLCGELGRIGVNMAIRKKPKEVLLAKEAVDEIYSQLLIFDFRNGELRKKFDGVKYALKRLEDISLDMSVKR